jgi:hypothetical protein
VFSFTSSLYVVHGVVSSSIRIPGIHYMV